MQTTRMCGLAVLASALALGCGDGEDVLHGASTGGAGGAGGAAGSGGSAGATGGSAGQGGVLDLAPGEVAEITVADGQSGIELATPSGNEKFVILLESNDLDASSTTFDYSLALGSAPANASGTLVTGCSLTSDAWASKQLTPETPPSGTTVAVGDTRDLDVGIPTGKETIQVKALAVGQYAVVWADVTAAHPAVLADADVQNFLKDYESIILPRERAIFGTESDLDKDGHIGLVFTPLTYQTAVAFFTGCDLQSQLGCPASNKGEYLYVTPPNAIDPPYNTPKAIKEILAHETSHMIHFNRKVLRNNLSGWADSMYMDEGVGGFAQDVSGYQAGNLYVTMAGLDGIDSYSVGETIVDNVQYDLTNDGVLRGGSYLFVRWFYDRAGGDEALSDGSVKSKGGPALLRTLLDSPDTIGTALPTQAGSSIEELAVDFWTTLAMSNRDVIAEVGPKNPCFAYLPTVTDPLTGNQRGANLYASFHGMQMNGPKMQNAASPDGSLRAGGGEIIELDAQPVTASTAFTLTVDPTAKSRVRVGRIQ